MIEVAKEALELAVRASEYGEEPEAIVGRARAFYEFLRAPVGASVHQTTIVSGGTVQTYADVAETATQGALSNCGPLSGKAIEQSCCGIVEKYRNS